MEDINSKSGLATNTLSMWQALAQGLGTNGPAAVTALFFVGIAGAVGGSMTLVIVLAFVIYCGMTLITYCKICNYLYVFRYAQHWFDILWIEKTYKN